MEYYYKAAQLVIDGSALYLSLTESLIALPFARPEWQDNWLGG